MKKAKLLLAAFLLILNTRAQHVIGEKWGGGIIFFVYDNGQHGLIAAPRDVGGMTKWFNDSTRYAGASGDGLNAGVMNTALIIASQRTIDQFGNIAAQICANYIVKDGGILYGDWYLPSQYELNLLYQQRSVVDGFYSDSYWSSTENDINTAIIQHFNDGTGGKAVKSNVVARVRAIRAF